ncbi:MAG: type II toxin-antitoxin system RelE/ParE family toxin [Bryobacteraceae bacterium]
MQIRWSPAAVDDLEQIFNYIRIDDPGAAERVAQTIYDRAAALGATPYLGRHGRWRERANYPYRDTLSSLFIASSSKRKQSRLLI